jgi:deoxyribonuclease IV
VHSGSHGGDGEEEGLERLAEGLDEARRLAEGFAAPSGQVAESTLENSVGAGTQLCSTFEALVSATRRVGTRACVDTAHAFVAGYDLSMPEGTRAVAEELRAAVGDRIALVHLNDARNELGSRRDGHRRIGEGRVPEGCWRVFFVALPGVPVVMETPYGTPEVDAEQVRLVKELAGGLPNESVGR